MTPYILLGRKKLPQEKAPSPDEVYDENLQIWIDKNSGAPLVSHLRVGAQPTKFGETTITETREGVDQPEGAVHASEFGEALQTRTREGIDKTEGTSLQASQVGETTMTKTREGVDRTEGGATLQEFDAAYSHF